jgi:hypothetical protein
LGGYGLLIDSYAVMGETGNVQADSGRSASLLLGKDFMLQAKERLLEE